VRFEIPGRPMPKQRPRVGRYGNIYAPRETKSYEELVGIVARHAGFNAGNASLGVNNFDGGLQKQA